jgi:hypothetical protein
MAVWVRHFENNHPRAVRSADRRTVGTGYPSVAYRIGNRLVNRSPDEYDHPGDDSTYHWAGATLPDHEMIATTRATHSSRCGAGSRRIVRETNRVRGPLRFDGISARTAGGLGCAFPLPANATATRAAVMIDTGRVARPWSGPMSTTCPPPCPWVPAGRTPATSRVSFGIPIVFECTQCSEAHARIGIQLCTRVSEQNPRTPAGRTVWAVRSSGRRRTRPGTSALTGGTVDTLVSGPSFRSPVGRIHQPCWK